MIPRGFRKVACMKEFIVRTNSHTEFCEITDRLQEAVDESGVKEGVCVAFVPHTTAGITINENADPDVVSDMIYALEKPFLGKIRVTGMAKATRRRTSNRA